VNRLIERLGGALILPEAQRALPLHRDHAAAPPTPSAHKLFGTIGSDVPFAL
jgi:hypothetical protein